MGSPDERLMGLLDEAIALDRASKGNIQVLDSVNKVLALDVLQRGFEEPFLHYFKIVKTFDTSACGRALGTGNCVLIPDIMSDVAYEAHRETWDWECENTRHIAAEIAILLAAASV